MDKISPQDDDAQSLASNLTGSIENDTDTLGRQILQHQRDGQRINDLMQNHHPQAFRKARLNPRIALTLDNLERNNYVNDGRSLSQGPMGHRPPSIGSSNDSDPPLNVPREWGRKGRQNNGWMRRIRQDEDAVLRHTASFAGHESSQVDWAAAADQPLGSGEQGTPSSQRQQGQTSTPPSLRQQNNSLDRIREWEADQDLTTASLLASTPALPSRNRTVIEEIRQREIEVIQQRGVASSRRQVYEQTPSESRRRFSGENNLETMDGQAHTATRPSSSSTARRPLRRPSVISNKENIPIIFGGEGRSPPLVMNKSVESIGVVDQGNQATAQRNTPAQRPQQKRTDSMALLRRLARVSSASPSSAQAKEDVQAEIARLDGNTQADELRDAQDTPLPLSGRNSNSNIANGQPKAPSQPNSSHPRVGADMDNTPKPDHRPTSAPQTGEGSQAQQGKNNRLPHETPIVTGAWIDTPRANAGDTTAEDIRIALDNLTTDGLIPRPRSAPPLPSSALDAVLQDLRSNTNPNDEPNLGDSTILSLEEILHPTSADPTITLDIPDSALLDASLADAWASASTIPIDITPTTQSERDRRQELLAIESMNNHLRTARTTLKDTSRALRKVEHDFEAANTASPAKARPAAVVPDQQQAQTHTHTHGVDGTCGSCGRHTSVTKALFHEYLSLFYVPSPSSRFWGIKLTRLGAACLAFWIWFVVENTLW